MKVYQRLAANFKAEGVTHMFGIMGDGEHVLDARAGQAGRRQDARSPP